ncbi:MAG: hypothetical protein DHS20C21_05670 [Gemmatimonadota bacterium]|nr:MAG: hypothetical protein DHS20C21_05670 [Gemmatimonadota bacterium]
MKARRARSMVAVLVGLVVTLASSEATAIFPDWCGVCADCGDNPYARIEEFWIEDGTLHCVIGIELDTDHYEIDTTPSVEAGIWGHVANLSPGETVYNLPLPVSNGDYVRLVEVDSMERRRTIAVARAGESVTVAAPEPPLSHDEVRKLIATATSRLQEERGPLLLPTEELVIYAPNSFSLDLQGAMGYWGWWYQTTLVAVEQFGDPNNDPDGVRQALKSDIATRAAEGAKYFLLVGDANDWREFDGPLTSTLWTGVWETVRQLYLAHGFPSGGQPSRNIIPTFVVADNIKPAHESQTAWYPYYTTDQPYADTNNDGRMDVVVTRWPAGSPLEVSRLSNKTIEYAGLEPAAPGGADILMWDWWGGTFNSALVVRSVGAEVEASLATAGRTATSLRAFPNYGESNLAALSADRWNFVPSDLKVIVASESHRYSPGQFFSKKANTSSFDIAALEEGRYGFVLAPTCGTADFAVTEDADFGAPLCQEFLTSYARRGAVGWIGPTAGSWQQGNIDLLRLIVEELNSGMTRSVAESWLIAHQRYYDQHNSDDALMRNAQSYVFLGDPVTKISANQIPTGVGGAGLVVERLELAAPSPNPTASGPVEMLVALPTRSMMELTVYDVRGREVRSLVSGVRRAGRYRVAWDAADNSGVRVASGVYFARLTAGRETRVRKIVFLR